MITKNCTVFPHRSYDNLKDLQDATLAANYPKGVTFTGDAMKKAREQFELDMRKDNEVKKVSKIIEQTFFARKAKLLKAPYELWSLGPQLPHKD